ncbi:MAG: hypothetical protein HQM14_15595 [SAR324 cluster bacterium]|nr:hypothetical protein [SAR324 cluster bacterium]
MGKKIAVIFILFSLMPATVFAEDYIQTKLNYIWVIASAAIVFLMQAGFMC